MYFIEGTVLKVLKVMQIEDEIGISHTVRI
jgi:hypothetical protein